MLMILGVLNNCVPVHDDSIRPQTDTDASADLLATSLIASPDGG
jgi:hypothetical protein